MTDQELKWLNLIAELAQEESSECYLVGGYLRDIYLNRPNKDLDFALSKNPKKLAQKFSDRLNFSFFVLHEKEEIYRVSNKEGHQFDFATFKGSTIQEDLSLRDFSINAMAYPITKLGTDPKGSVPNFVLDPHQGRKDIANKIVRQVSPNIYQDDPLRLIRAFRFQSQLQFEIDSSTYETIKQEKNLIQDVAKERVREELLLLLESSKAYPTLLNLDESGLISQLFPEVDPNRTCALHYYPEKGVWGHSLDAFKYLEWIFDHLESEFPENCEKIKSFLLSEGGESGEKSWYSLMKLAVLLHDVGKAPTAQMVEGRMRFYEHQNVGAKLTRTAAERLKFSSNGSRNLSRMVLEHMRPGGLAFAPNLTERARFRFFRDLGINAIPTLIVSLADRYTYLKEEEIGKGTDIHEKLVKDFILWYYKKVKEDSHKKKPIIDGTILMKELHIPPSPTVGTLLKEIEEALAIGEIHTQEEALTFARKLLGN